MNNTQPSPGSRRDRGRTRGAEPSAKDFRSAFDAELDAMIAIYTTARDSGRGVLASEQRAYQDHLRTAESLCLAEARRLEGKGISVSKTMDELATEIRSRLDNIDERVAGALYDQPPPDEDGPVNRDEKKTVRKIKFGPDRPSANYDKLQALAPEHSVREWVAARAGGSDYNVDEAWNALAAGLIHDEWGAWHSLRAGLSSSGEGGELIPSPLAGDVIDLMRSATPIFQAGATTVPMTARTLDIARLTDDPSATAWHAEAGTITPDSAMALDRVTFTAKTLPVLVKASRELSEDAPNLGSVVRGAIAGAMGVELTRAALRGNGAANSPTGIRNATGVTITELGAGNGAAASYDTVLDATQVIEDNNTSPNAVIWTPRTKTSLAKLKDSQGNYLKPPDGFTDLGRYTTTVIPKNLTVGTSNTCTEIYTGRWSDLLIGMRTTMSIKVLDQRYADTGEIAFMAWLRADVQLAHGESFVVNTGVTN